jgi:uncharacterized protein with HEPN domain
MNLKTKSILEHMLEDALDAMKFANEVGTVEAFSVNKLYRKAVIMSILNIGELAKNLPPDFKTAHTSIPWKKITGMRDVAAHGYHEMDDDVIWDVVKYSIPDLADFIEKQLI